MIKSQSKCYKIKYLKESAFKNNYFEKNMWRQIVAYFENTKHCERSWCEREDRQAVYNISN